MLHVKTLGELRQVRAGDAARSLRRKPLALAAYLARSFPRNVSRTELATLFWGERSEERARQSLRQALLELKQSFGDAVDVDAEAVRLAQDAVQLDVAEFEAAISAGSLEAAAQLWTGDFFEGAEDIGGDGFRRWIENERVGLHRQLGMAFEKLIGDAERKGDWVAAADWAERWARALPFEESAQLRLIEALRMTGRNSEAIKTHTAFVSRLRGALDLEPSAEFLRLGGGLAETARSELQRMGRGSAAVHAPQLVGRSAVVSELADAWKRVAAGAQRSVLIRGEAGAGLTRMCDELAERAGSEAALLRARGTAGADFSTLAELLDGIRHAAGTAGAAPEDLAAIARIVPALAARFQHLPAGSGDDAALRDATVRVLSAIAEEQPVLLLVDDLHAADARSRQLICAIAPRLNGRVMLVLTDDEGTELEGNELREVLASRSLTRLQLEPLGIADVEAMLASMLSMDAADRRALAARLHEDTGGQPHAVRELVNALVDEHLLQLDPSGTWRVSAALAGRALPVPPAVRDRVRARLDQLSPGARATAEAVAVLGAPGDPAIAAEVAELSSDDAETALRELRSRRVLRESLAQPGSVEFASPLVGRAVTALLPPTRRQSLHATAARVLSARDLATTAERSLLPYHLARATEERLTREPASLPPTPLWRRRVFPLAGIAAAALVAVALFAWRSRARAGANGDPVPIVALGRIADYRGSAGSDLTHPLTDMLATNLGRVPRLRVVSSARMYELVGQASGQREDTSAAALVAAARRAGATELLDGALYARDDGGLRLDLRRVELKSGNILQTYSVTGATVFDLADSGTARLAADVGGSKPAGSIADVTTRSLAAYRLYEQGLRAYYNLDYRTAQPLFEAALKEDSTFAMAAFYSAVSETEDSHRGLARFALAKRLASHTTDRERLTILARYAFAANSAALLPLADTLVVRYPDEVDGYYFTGLARLVVGPFLDALAPLERVVAMDSLALGGARPNCLACDALRQIVSAYQLADSLPAAERTLRRWIRLQPNSPSPWLNLADILSQRGRYAEALAAFDSSAKIGTPEATRLTSLAIHHIYGDNFEQADRLLTGEISSGVAFRKFQALWFRSISLRQQGRLNEALADTRRYRSMALALFQPRGIVERHRAAPQEAFGEAELLFELGRYRASAALFDSVGRWVVGDESISALAHIRGWALTHASRALAAAGDTTELAARADSIEADGSRTGSGRDRLLHHYVRGLLLAARGQDAAAVEEYKQAVWSWNFGYTRVNMTLATTLLRLQRPAEAVPALQSALRGNIEASNYYASRTELQELLAQAFDAMGTPAARDSAVTHYRVVEHAWSRADASLAPRLAQVKSRLAALAAR